MDMSMPVMNGLDAARVLKRLMPTVPIIMYSNFSDVLVEKEVRSAAELSQLPPARFLPHCIP